MHVKAIVVTIAADMARAIMSFLQSPLGPSPCSMYFFYGSSVREGQRLDRDDMEELGINDVMRRVNPIRKLFLPRPRFYVTDTFSQNAYSSGRNIMIALDVFDEGIEVAQGVIAHELGHYYHYDTDASLICNVAINTRKETNQSSIEFAFIERRSWFPNFGMR